MIKYSAICMNIENLFSPLDRNIYRTIEKLWRITKHIHYEKRNKKIIQ